MRADLAAGANLNAILDHGVRANSDVISNFRCLRNNRRGMDALDDGRLRKHPTDRAGVCEFWILGAQKSLPCQLASESGVRADYDAYGPRARRELHVFG
jgi:hypothetical protein